jgi:hypothetical protein
MDKLPTAMETSEITNDGETAVFILKLDRINVHNFIYMHLHK